METRERVGVVTQTGKEPVVKYRWWIAGALGGAIGAFLGYALVSPRAQIVGTSIWHGPRNRREIALTFDNGPSPDGTERVLELLRSEGVKATFFLLGRATEAYPHLAQAIVNDGHQIGNHGYTHKNLLWACAKTTAQQLDRGYHAIEAACGVGPTIYRPAYGTRNFFMPKLLRQRGWKLIHWAASAGDWRVHGARKLTGWLPHVRNGDILLWHDGLRHEITTPRTVTIAALSQVIPFLRERGFTFVTVDHLLRDTTPVGAPAFA